MQPQQPTTPSAPAFTGAFGLFSKSWEVIRRNIVLFLSLAAIDGAMSIYLAMQPSPSETASLQEIFEAYPGGLKGFIVVFIISTIIILLQTLLSIRAVKGQKPTFSVLMQDFAKYGLTLAITYFILILVVVTGFAALIVPGIFMVAWFSLAPYILVDKQTSILGAFKESRRISKGHFSLIWGIVLVTLLISLPGAFGVVGTAISLVLVFIYSTALNIRYEELKAAASGQTNQA